MTRHIPVLLPEVLEYLDLQSGDTVLDATIGSAGYSQAIATSIGEDGKLVGTDADAAAIRGAKEKLADTPSDVCLQVANFRTLTSVLETCDVETLDAAVFDLGFRSEQLEMGRGFSFQEDAPLVMTFMHPDDVSAETVTAYDVVNDWSEESLISILEGYGNERHAKKIVAGIMRAREREPIETTDQLVRVIKNSVPLYYRNGRRHPATLTFQAIRIAVNDEVAALKEGVQAAFQALQAEGRLVIVSFHSLEDRMVKEFFSSRIDAGEAQWLTERPVTAGEEEISFNPRSRSAKLRAVRKCPTA